MVPTIPGELDCLVREREGREVEEREGREVEEREGEMREEEIE